MRTIETPKAKILTLLVALGAVATAVALSGAADGSCIPIEEPVCFADVDCGAGMMCDLDANACVDATVTIAPSATSYASGEPVTFHVDPHGVSMETGGWDALYAYIIDRLDPVTMEWVELRAGMPFGCYMTDCIDDQPMILCVDPAPPSCVERVEPYDLVWDGYLWNTNDTDCGGQLRHQEGFPYDLPDLHPLGPGGTCGLFKTAA